MAELDDLYNTRILELAAAVPPAMGQLAELRQFLGVGIDAHVAIVGEDARSTGQGGFVRTNKNPAEAGFFSAGKR